MTINHTINSLEPTLPAPTPDSTAIFNWRHCWYPIAFVQDLPPDRLHPFSLYGESLVLFKDQQQQLACLVDQCCHRAAKLSDRFGRALLEATVQQIFGFPQVIPTHQGRAVERLFTDVLIQPGMIVPNNTHFDTTRANIEAAGGRAIDLPCVEASNLLASAVPFKGDMNVAALEQLIAEVGAENIPVILLTVTNNSGGGQPVSIANLQAVSQLAHFYGIPLYIDACRFAENAYFIQQCEDGYDAMSVREIVLEMFSYADGCLMSAKKDVFANMGGFLCTRDESLAEELRRLLILTEGFPTYGGFAGREWYSMLPGTCYQSAFHIDHTHILG
ncbi:MAG: tryptophanase [Leptolyngbyaceae cyanobacterium HOT.MB2.61]|nr:tryptophanase [Leptolyngbyaceae cyanobacterium HOT.MB2.61]